MVHPYLELVDKYWWSPYDFRRLWTPRFMIYNEHLSGFLYLLGRLIATSYLFSTAVFDASETNATPGFYIAFLTIQGVWLTICYFVSVTLLSFVTYVKPYLCNYSNPVIPHPSHWTHYAYCGWLRATHVLFEIAICYELIIVALYWTLLAGNHVTLKAWYKDIAVHGLMFAFIWTELFLSSHRLPDRHAWIILGTTFGYILWNIGVTFTVHYVYPVLKWDGAGSVILAIGSIIFAILVFFLGSSIAYIRDSIASKILYHIPHGGAEECVCCTKGGRCCWYMNKITVPNVENVKSNDLFSNGRSKEVELLRTENKSFSSSSSVQPTTGSNGSLIMIDWSTIYPRTFTDDIVAWPCSSCKGCYGGSHSSPFTSSSTTVDSTVSNSNDNEQTV